MNILLVGVLALSLTACGKVSQIEAKLTGNAMQSKDGKIIIGRIKLPDGHFSDSWYVETREARLHENDLLVVSPFDYWFRDNQDKLYDAILNMYMRKSMEG